MLEAAAANSDLRLGSPAQYEGATSYVCICLLLFLKADIIKRNIANFPTSIDFINNNFSLVTRNGTMADCIRNGKIKSGNMRVTISYFLLRPANANDIK